MEGLPCGGESGKAAWRREHLSVALKDRELKSLGEAISGDRIGMMKGMGAGEWV